MSSMREYRDYMARVAKCEQKATSVQDEDERQSWLALADSWRQTAELQRSLNPQLPLYSERRSLAQIPVPAVSGRPTGRIVVATSGHWDGKTPRHGALQ